jgi:DNA-binding transcriptional LysR family regulator
VQTGQVGAAAHLAAAGLGVAILPDNIVPAGLAADVRPLESPVADEFVAFSRGGVDARGCGVRRFVA